MPRLDELKVSDSPFARVLTAYMWSKTPPWSASKLAAVLGIQRARVAKWVYGDTVPELDTILVVMAKLGIPVRFLVEAYAASGIPVPPLDVDEAQVSAEQEQRAALLGESASQFYGIPAARRGRGGGVHNKSGAIAPQEPQTQQQPAPRPAPAPRTTGASAASRATATGAAYDEETPDVARGAGSSEQEQEQNGESWDKMIAHTRKVMAMAGMPASALEAMLAEIEHARDKDTKDTTDPKDTTDTTETGTQREPRQPQRQKPEPAR